MMELSSIQPSKAPRHVKVFKVDPKKLDASSRKSTLAETRAKSAGSAPTQTSTSKNKVFPSDDVPLNRLSSISSIPMNNETSSSSVLKEPAPVSPKTKPKCPKILTIVLVTLVSICALAALGIGLYFLITTNIKTTSTTTTSTTSTCSMALCWNTSGTTALGTGSSGASSDRLNSPRQLVIDSSGSFYVADAGNNRVQKFTSSSVIGTTVAGQSNGNSGGTSFYLSQPTYVLLDSSGNLYVADTSNHRIQFFTSGSMAGVTIAGNGSYGSGLNQLNSPHGLARDTTRSILYISDTSNHRIIAYSSGAVSGVVVAGGNGQGSLSNQLNTPMGLYLDVSSNSLYIANNAAHNIVRWVVNASTWTLIAGNGNGQSGSTPTTLYSPADITFDYMGNLYVADTGNQRIQFFLPGKFNGTTIAGVTNVYTYAANTLSGPQSVALDSNLNLYVADSGNNRIQEFQRY